MAMRNSSLKAHLIRLICVWSFVRLVIRVSQSTAIYLDLFSIVQVGKASSFVIAVAPQVNDIPCRLCLFAMPGQTWLPHWSFSSSSFPLPVHTLEN